MEDDGGLICEHIREHYPLVTGEPPVFWIFAEERLPDGYEIQPSEAGTTDPCHYQVQEVSNDRLWKLFKRVNRAEFKICDDGSFRELSEEDVSEFPA